jgi:hypothetical protein
VSCTCAAWAACQCCAAAPVCHMPCSVVDDMLLKPISTGRPSGRMLWVSVLVRLDHISKGMTAGASCTPALPLLWALQWLRCPDHMHQSYLAAHYAPALH